jgi:hypothetical protein
MWLRGAFGVQSRKFSPSTIILVLLLVGAFGFSLAGWAALAERLELSTGDIIIRTLVLPLLYSPWETAKNWMFDWRLEVARVLGMAVFVIAATKTIGLLVAKQADQWRGRQRSGHLIVIGDHPLAKAAVAAARARKVPTTWMDNGQPDDDGWSIRGSTLHVPGGWDLATAERFALRRAARCAIAYTDDARTLAVARDIRAGSNSPALILNLQDPWLMARIEEAHAWLDVRLGSVPRAAARSLHARHPPFLIAHRYNQARLHALIIGFGGFGEAVLLDLLMTAHTRHLGKPRVTIVDPHTSGIAADLALRYPELDECVDIEFVAAALAGENPAGAHGHLDAKTFARINDAAPITVSYVCTGGDSGTLRVGFALQTLLRDVHAEGPIFLRLRNNGALAQPSAGVAGLAARQLVPFGPIDDLLEAMGFLDDEVDALAKAFHTANQALATGESRSNLPWEELDESYREANRRLVAHIPAKLASAGYDVDAWLSSTRDKRLPHIEGFAADAETRLALATLEHDRWMTERRLSGWRYAAERDNTRRHHPDLVPFDALPADVQAFDFASVDQLAAILAKAR